MPQPIIDGEALLGTILVLLLVWEPEDFDALLNACPGQDCPRVAIDDQEVVCVTGALGGNVIACFGDCSVATGNRSLSAIKGLFR